MIDSIQTSTKILAEVCPARKSVGALKSVTAFNPEKVMNIQYFWKKFSFFHKRRILVWFAIEQKAFLYPTA